MIAACLDPYAQTHTLGPRQWQVCRHVRGGFVSRLRHAIKDGRFERITDTAEINAMLDALMSTDWVVYSKPCLTHTETVVDYLGRYSHRIALSDARLLSLEDGQVDLAYKDYRDGNRKLMTLALEELLRRFLLHVLPKGFMRIRYFGFLANRCRRERLAQIRVAIDAEPSEATAESSDQQDRSRDRWPCPKCPQGRLRVIGEIAPKTCFAGAPRG